MKLYLEISNREREEINIWKDLILRAANTNILDCRFRDKYQNEIDITGYTIFVTIKENISDTDDNVVIKKDITSHTNAVAGRSKIEFTPADMSTFVGNFIYSIAIKTDTGNIYTVSEGSVCIKKELSDRINITE